jgi:DNA-binding transcriptional ArsR family regulator
MLSKDKMTLYKRQADILQAIGQPIRIAIANFLKDGEQCVCDIAEFVGSERSNVSKHLSVMVNAGLLESRKEGLKVIYRLKCPCILEFFKCMSSVLKQRVKDDKEILKAL